MLLLLDALQTTHTLARALSKHVSKAFALLQCKISHWRPACTGVVCLPASNPQSSKNQGQSVGLSRHGHTTACEHHSYDAIRDGSSTTLDWNTPPSRRHSSAFDTPR